MGAAMFQCQRGCCALQKHLIHRSWLLFGRLASFSSSNCWVKRAYGMKTKPCNCVLWSGCVKYVQNIYYLEDPKDVEEALTDPKAHWDSMEKSKVRKTKY